MSRRSRLLPLHAAAAISATGVIIAGLATLTASASGGGAQPSAPDDDRPTGP